MNKKELYLACAFAEQAKRYATLLRDNYPARKEILDIVIEDIEEAVGYLTKEKRVWQ